jgi:hypothetical protein
MINYFSYLSKGKFIFFFLCICWDSKPTMPAIIVSAVSKVDISFQRQARQGAYLL